MKIQPDKDAVLQAAALSSPSMAMAAVCMSHGIPFDPGVVQNVLGSANQSLMWQKLATQEKGLWLAGVLAAVCCGVGEAAGSDEQASVQDAVLDGILKED